MTTLRKASEAALEALETSWNSPAQLDAIDALRAALAAEPERGSQMTVVDIADDDALRFAQRVLESDAPSDDRKAARDMIVAIRTRLRSTPSARAALLAELEAKK